MNLFFAIETLMTKIQAPKNQTLDEVVESLRTRIAAKESQVGDFAETLRLIEEQPRWRPQPGELEPFDRMNELLEGEKSEAARQAKLKAAKRALEIGQGELMSLHTQLERAVEQQQFEIASEIFEAAIGKYHQQVMQLESEWSNLQELIKEHPTICGGNFPRMQFGEGTITARVVSGKPGRYITIGYRRDQNLIGLEKESPTLTT